MKTLAEALGTGPEELVLLFDLPISFHRCLVPATGAAVVACNLGDAVAAGRCLRLVHVLQRAVDRVDGTLAA